MPASVHIADLGAKSVLEVLRHRPKEGEVPGLVKANVANAAPLRTGAVPKPQLGRLALVAFWESDSAIDAFEASHPIAEVMSSGWRVRLEPLRRHGSWPGVPESLPTARSAGADGEGPFAVLTLGQTRVSQLVRFLRTSAPAEAEAVASPGMIWGTAMSLPMFFATCSLWSSARALSTYAYGRARPAHPDAIEVDKARQFHHQSAFVRFRPYASVGSLSGKNPLPEDWATSLAGTPATTE